MMVKQTPGMTFIRIIRGPDYADQSLFIFSKNINFEIRKK
jgi:hypothetical protein